MKDKKVGIMTLNGSDNYGGVLQAYALSHFIEQNGYSPFSVNFESQKVPLSKYFLNPIAAYQKVSEIEAPLKSFMSKVNKKSTFYQNPAHVKAIFDDFRRNHLNFTKERLTHSMLSLQCPGAHAYVTGSDVVWATDAFFNTPAFLLDFVPEHMQRIAYAPSFGKGELEPYQRSIFSTELKKFDHLSAREQSGAELVESLSGKDCLRVLDPTFLPANYDSILDTSTNGDEPYVLVYLLPQAERLTKRTESLLHKMKEKIKKRVVFVSLEGASHNTDVFECAYPTPGQFLGLIEGADSVITNSFHGVVFSLLFDKKFVCVPRDTAKNKKNLRMLELLNLIGKDSNFFTKLESVESLFQTLETSQKDVVANEKLEKYVERSRDYLLGALKS